MTAPRNLQKNSVAFDDEDPVMDIWCECSKPSRLLLPGPP